MSKKIIIGVIVAAVVVIGGVITFVVTRPRPAVEMKLGNINYYEKGDVNAFLANPDSTFCVANGGRVDVKTSTFGSLSGDCVFKDYSSCDVRAYSLGNCKPGDSLKPNPVGFDIPPGGWIQ